MRLNDFQLATLTRQCLDNGLIFPAGIIEHRHEIAGAKPEHLHQVSELLTVDNAAAFLDVCLRQKKPGHNNSIAGS